MSEKRPGIVKPVIWTALFLSGAVGNGFRVASDPTDWVAAAIAGAFVTFVFMEWIVWSYKRLAFDYGEIIDQYHDMVESLVSDEPTP